MVRNQRINPMDPENPKLSRLNRAPRCLAQNRRGTPCQSPAVGGRKRCRMHGGADGVGAPKGNQNALKHGRYTAETTARRREMAALLRACRDQLADMCRSG